MAGTDAEWFTKSVFLFVFPMLICNFADGMRKSSFDTLVFALVLLLALQFLNRRSADQLPESAQTEQGSETALTDEPPAGEAMEEASDEYSDAEFQDEAEASAAVPDGLEIPQSEEGRVLQRRGYVTAYADRWRCPLWTAWHLTAGHTTGPYKRKGVKYHEDDDVPFPKATNADYAGSGYDRGHMCPSGDNKWSREAQEDCFLFTNMCPQSHNLNGGDWNDLEMKCRKWAEKYGDVYIVCGPVFRSEHPRTIGKSKVAVPDGFYKVVLCMRDEPKAIGFYYDNDDGHAPMASYVRTVDEIESLTGIDFFPRLDDATERRIEAKADLDEW